MKKIGIMGGTFNPIHKGHVDIAVAAYEQFSLDEIWFMPNNIPAYKSTKGIVSGKDRYNMISLAIAEHENFKVSDFELIREGKTYSYETFTLLNRKYPDCKFYFIMGADSLFYFEQWVHPEIILDNADLLVASRDENGIERIRDKIKELNLKYKNSRIDIIKCKEIDCSSSTIREYLSLINDNASDKDELISYIDKYLSNSVKNYITENYLY